MAQNGSSVPYKLTHALIYSTILDRSASDNRSSLLVRRVSDNDHMFNNVSTMSACFICYSKFARAFVHRKLFRPSVIFARKVGAYQIGEPLRGSHLLQSHALTQGILKGEVSLYH